MTYNSCTQVLTSEDPRTRGVHVHAGLIEVTLPLLSEDLTLPRARPHPAGHPPAVSRVNARVARIDCDCRLVEDSSERGGHITVVKKEAFAGKGGVMALQYRVSSSMALGGLNPLVREGGAASTRTSSRSSQDASRRYLNRRRRAASGRGVRARGP